MNKDTAKTRKNTETSASPSLPDTIRTIRCVGDSITEGWSLPDPQAQSWPALLEQRFPQTAFQNYGSAGAAVQSFLPNAWENTLAARVAFSRPADLTLLFLGTNDAEQLTPHFADEYHRLATRLQNLGPVITVIPPRTAFSPLNRRLEKIRSAILAAGFPVIDLWNVPVQLAGDGMHPTVSGQKQTAEAIGSGLIHLLGHSSPDCPA